MDQELKRHYTQLVDFLGHILGQDYEIALHELDDDANRIVAIANGELTGRRLGSPLSNKMLEFVAGSGHTTEDYVLRFESTAANGNKMCSNSMFIRDSEGELEGLLCINFDSSRYEELAGQVLQLCDNMMLPRVESGTNLIADSNDPSEVAVPRLIPPPLPAPLPVSSPLWYPVIL